MADSQNAALEKLSEREYQYGFVTDIESESVPPGLNEGDRPADLEARRTSRSGCSRGG